MYLKLFLHNLGTLGFRSEDTGHLKSSYDIAFGIAPVLVLFLHDGYWMFTHHRTVSMVCCLADKNLRHPSTQNVSFQMMPSTLEVNRRIHRHCSWLQVLILFHQ